MKERDIIYIENDILQIVQLYIESYLMQKEKGFSNISERQLSKENVRKNIEEVIEETGEELNTSIEEIIGILMNCISQNKQSSEKVRCFQEEYSLLEEILQEIISSMIKKEEQEER